MKSNLYYKFSIVIALLCLSLSVHAQRIKYHRISATIEPQKLEYLFNNGLEIDHFGYEQKKYFTAEVSDEDLALFKKNNVKYNVIIEDLEENLAKYNAEIDKKANKNAKLNVATPANFALGSYGGFFTFTEMQNILDQMRTLYPNLISAKTSIGTSVEGRPIYMVKISDNPDADEAEPEMFWNAVHHAREPVSMSQLIFTMWHLLENYNSDKDIKTLLNSTEIYIVPCVNPDGYVYNQTTNPNGGGMWRKNRKNNGNGTYGVDINRNYGYKWGYDNTGSSPTTSSDTYRGTAAFSEPETQVIRNFCNAHAFTLSMDFHAYGNYCIYPYGYTSINPNPEISTFQQMGAFFTAENGFVHGNTIQTVAYTANGAGDDWKYGEQTTKPKIYSFTPEVGASTDGFWPASSRIIPLCNSTIEMNKKALKVATFFAKVTPAATTTLSTTSGAVSYSIQNFSVKPTTYKVSLSSTSSYVTSVGSPKTYTNPTLLQNQTDNITFTIDPLTPLGTQIQFDIVVDNGLSPQTETVTITYDCLAPSSLTTTAISTTGATLNWGTVAGASGYWVSYKENTSSTWSSETFTATNSYSLSGLTANTNYNWRVRKDSCNNYSSIVNFTTQPLCTTPSSLTSTSITSTGATLNWGAVSGVLNYTVEYKLTTATTWTTAASAATSTSLSLTGLASSTAYDWRVKANCSAGGSAYASASFTTNSSVTYCASKSNNVAIMWIDYVKVGTINQTSGGTAGGYFNGTAISTNLVRGSTNAFQFSPGFASTIYRIYWRVWIDYNKNGVFTDAGEQIMSVSTTGSGTYSVNFIVPTTASLGNTRIRVSAKYSASPTSCETFTYGEVEDYTVNITTATAKNQITNASLRLIYDENEGLEEGDWDFETDAEALLARESAKEEIEVDAYPNPVMDRILVRVNTLSNLPRKVKILNLQGGEIMSKELLGGQSEVNFDTKDLMEGSYYIQLQDANRRKTIKIVKE